MSLPEWSLSDTQNLQVLVGAQASLCLARSLSEKALHAIDTATESHEQRLDFRRGVSSRETVFLSDAAGPGTCVTLKSERFASMAHGNLLCSKVTLSATPWLMAGVSESRHSTSIQNT